MTQEAEKLPDRKVLACNLLEATSEFSKGALAYVYNNNPGWGGERMELYARSRSGRWILKWEPIYRLHNFRFKTLPPERRLYFKEEIAICASLAERLLERDTGVPPDYNVPADAIREERANRRRKKV